MRNGRAVADRVDEEPLRGSASESSATAQHVTARGLYTAEGRAGVLIGWGLWPQPVLFIWVPIIFAPEPVPKSDPKWRRALSHDFARRSSLSVPESPLTCVGRWNWRG